MILSPVLTNPYLDAMRVLHVKINIKRREIYHG